MSPVRIDGLWHPDPSPPAGLAAATASTEATTPQTTFVEPESVIMPDFRTISFGKYPDKPGLYVIRFYSKQIRVVGDENGEILKGLKSELFNLLQKEYNIDKIILDFRDVESLTPAAANMFVSVKNSYGKYIKLRLCNIKAEVLRDGFEAARVKDKFDIKPDLASALEGF